LEKNCILGLYHPSFGWVDGTMHRWSGIVGHLAGLVDKGLAGAAPRRRSDTYALTPYNVWQC